MPKEFVPEHTVMRDGLLRPGPAVAERTIVSGVREVVSANGTFRVFHNCNLVQLPDCYLIQSIETGAVMKSIPLNTVLWLKPEPVRAGYYDDWHKRWVNYD